MHSFRSHQHPVRARWSALLQFTALTALCGINAATGHAGTQRPAPLTGPAQAVIQQFLSSQAAGLPGKVVITIDTPMSGALPPCDAPEPFLPSGAKIWGRVSVGIRCNDAAPAAATASPGRQAWSRYVPAYVAVIAPYLVAARPIDAGETLTAADFTLREGDLTTLPRNILTGTAQIDGMVALNRLAAGAPVRPKLLRGAVVVQPGQNVKVMAQGAGFVASTEGRAMTGAAIGARLQVKTQSGQMVVGTVRADGSVELLN
jgi:flagellar basal body P-ring formation protein FlgA